ncbi:DUF2515 domain-containing protein [Bacillus benzoevorans]|uniref:DUF2515 domain-containing protein n=1 Tax=Bacillus benzoevorans TaxID=1456 RepID=A0A7X0HTE3_9BACI|nr:DUF2515 domain-containing protein [Bacillus benzoevorans]MBB6445266.1 hypothetical protein [Bacillus benzoevorans]
MQKFTGRKHPELSEALLKIKKDLKKKEGKNASKIKLSLEEKKLLEKIQQQTKQFNINNVTRTKAYLHFYNQYQDIHWAFLGHMVSRNGGWNMTDLKGEFLSKLLTKNEQQFYFTFLERGNWLIFQDAYPQFLVYEESRKRNKNLFHLLPYLQVSTFMETIWNHYWNERDLYLLTIALIINEQSYLEKRVIKNPLFQKNIFHSIEFKLQDSLSLNHILFPIIANGKTHVIGQTLHHFESLHERIWLGKRLYSILFHDKQLLSKAVQWANTHPHTGSRKDYWPHLFHDVKEGLPAFSLLPRLKSCQLIPGSPRIYSPTLTIAWKNIKHLPAEIDDWFQSWKVLYYFLDSKEKTIGEIQSDYCKTLERLELAAITKKAISVFE